MYKEIPKESKQIQEGLYLHEYSKKIAGKEYAFKQLFAATGYCFYDILQPDNYDEEGNMLPENERLYMSYMSCAYSSIDEINKNIISVINNSFNVV
jgi:hypothetical protein